MDADEEVDREGGGREVIVHEGRSPKRVHVLRYQRKSHYCSILATGDMLKLI